MVRGAEAIGDPLWSVVWVVGVACVQVAVALLLKRRIDRAAARS